jgi:hypothetical protein
MSANGWSIETVEACLERIVLPSAAKLQTKDYRASGKYPVIDQGQAFIAGWTNDNATVISAPLPLIVFGDHTRAFKFVDFPFARGADGTQILKPRDGIDPLYFYYACRAIDLPNRGYNRHFTILKAKEIRLAPPDEQQEIGRVLRRVESGIELQNRQFQASEDLKRAAMRELFTLGLRGEAQKETEIGPVPESWELTPFDQVFKLTSGNTRPSDLTDSQTDERTFPVLGGNGVMGFSRDWLVDAPRTLIIGRVGEYCGEIHTASGKIWITDNPKSGSWVPEASDFEDGGSTFACWLRPAGVGAADRVGDP